MLLMSVLPSHRIVVGADVTGVVARLRRLRVRLNQSRGCGKRIARGSAPRLFRQMEIERGA
jgi:hypothetical protein